MIIVGCSVRTDDPYQTRRSHFFNAFFEGNPYEEAFEDKTQFKRAHSEFEPVITAHVTFFDGELRQAYVNEKVRQYRFTVPEALQLARQQTQENADYLLFVASVNTKIFRWNSLEDRDGLWRVTLETPDGEVRTNPDRIEVIGFNDEQARYFYRKMTTFNRTYLFYFPRHLFQSADEVVLHITGPKALLRYPFELPRAVPEIQSPLQDLVKEGEKKQLGQYD